MASGKKKLKSSDIDKSKSSLVLNYENEEEKKAEKSSIDFKVDKGEKLEGTENTTNTKTKSKKKNKKKTSAEVEEKLEKNKEEFDKQINTLKNITSFLGKRFSSILNMGIGIIKKVNTRFFGKKYDEPEEVEVVEEVVPEPEVEEPFSFKTFIDMNLIFTDNKKKPLYIAPKKTEGMYTQNDDILTAATIDKIIDVFKETAEKMKKDPVPEAGFYKGVPLSQVLRNIDQEQLYQFLFYVRRFPAKYIGQNYRISESFAAWVMSGTPME